MTQAGPELRVLEGAHRGASVPLPSLGSTLTLGRAPDNDVVLLDAPFESATWRSTVQGGMWRDDSGDHRVTLGQGLRFGALALVVCSSSDPWEAQPPSGWALDQQQPDDLALTGPSETVQGEPVQDTIGMPDDGPEVLVEELSEAAQRMQPFVPAKASRSRRALASLAVMATVAMALWWGYSHWGLSSSAQSPSLAAARAASAAAQLSGKAADGRVPDLKTTQAVAKAIEHLVSPGSVKTALYPGGRVQLQGVVDTDENIERIVREAAKVTPLLKLSLMSQAEFTQRVKALGAVMPEGASLRSENVGVVVVSGTVSDDTALTNVRSLVNEELPFAQRVVVELMTAQQRAELEARALAARTPKVPQLSAVVGGPRPFVVLPNGQKVQPGGMVTGLTLSSIDADAVIFEDATGTKFRWTR